MLVSFYVLHVFFFFKQKTAYEMRISDWSSDVCSSDLFRMVGDQPQRAVIALEPLRIFAKLAGADIAIDEKMRAACLAPFGAGGHRGQDQQGRKQPRYRSKQSHDSPRLFDEPILTATPWIATPTRGKIGRTSGRERGCQYVKNT